MSLKAVTNPAPYVSANIWSGMRGNARDDDSQDASLIRRAAGYVYRCAEINADRVCATPLHLYRRVRNSRAERTFGKAREMWAIADKMPGRPVSKSAVARLMKSNSVEVRQKVAAMGGELEEVPTHPVLDLLQKPNPDESGYDLLWRCQFTQEICGRIGWLKVVKGGLPVQLRSLLPQYLKPVYSEPGSDRMLKGFEYGVNTDRQRYAIDDVCYFTKPDPLDLAGSMGPLESGLQASDAELAIRQAQWQMFQWGSQIQYAIKTDGEMSEETRRSLESAWGQRWSGVRRWFRSLLILDRGIELVRLNDPPKDMVLSEALKDVLRDISIIFGVPMSMLTTEGGNKLGETSNAAQGSSDYVVNTLTPRLRRNESILNHQLLPAWEGEYVLAYELPYSEDAKGKAEVSAIVVGNALLTINEVREEMELPPVEGGDVLRYMGQPLSKIDAPPQPIPFAPGFGASRPGSAERPSEPDAGGTDPGADGETPPEPPVQRSVPARKSRKIKHYQQADIAVYGLDGLCQCKAAETDEPFTPDNFPDIEELAGGVRGVLEAMRDQLLAGVRASGGQKAAPGPASSELDRIFRESGYSYDEWVNAMTGELEKGLAAFIQAGAEQGRTALGSDVLGVAFDVTNPRVAEFLDGYRLRFREASASTVASVEADVRRALQAGLVEGDSTGGMEARLREAFDGFTPYRAELIARTESARAYSAGHEAAWVGNSNVVGKRWVLAPRACEFCQAVARDYGSAKIGQPFVRKGTTVIGTDGSTYTVGFADVDGPPLHPNDRCALVPVLEGDA